jgi:hypothetical protein
MKRYILLLFVHGYKSRGGGRALARRTMAHYPITRQHVTGATAFTMVLLFLVGASGGLAFVTNDPLFVITLAVTFSVLLLWGSGLIVTGRARRAAARAAARRDRDDYLPPLPPGTPPPASPAASPAAVSPSSPPFRALVDPADDACAICLDTEGGRVQLPCTHSYHRGCIMEWFNHRVTCPLCGRDPRETAWGAAERRTTPPETPAPAPTPPAEAP